jgi:hypothetical protein
MKEIPLCLVAKDNNVTDITTKVLPSGEIRDSLMEQLMYNITSCVEEVYTPKSGLWVQRCP